MGFCSQVCDQLRSAQDGFHRLVDNHLKSAAICAAGLTVFGATFFSSGIPLAFGTVAGAHLLWRWHVQKKRVLSTEEERALLEKLFRILDRDTLSAEDLSFVERGIQQLTNINAPNDEEPSRLAPNDHGRTLLHKAAEKGHVSVIEMLLYRGANIDVPSIGYYSGETPLYGALRYETTSAGAKKLLQEGARIEGISSERVFFNFTPLELACLSRDPEIALIMIQRGANTQLKLPEGRTLLHRTAHRGLASVAQKLVRLGADVNASEPGFDEYDGDTPLHKAVRKCAAEVTGSHREFIEFLLSEGADVGLRNQHGDTPDDLAKKAWRVDLVQLLVQDHVTRIRQQMTLSQAPQPNQSQQQPQPNKQQEPPILPNDLTDIVLQYAVSGYIPPKNPDPSVKQPGPR